MISTETSPQGAGPLQHRTVGLQAHAVVCSHFDVPSGNNLFHKARDGAAWQPGQTDWEDLGGDCTSARAVTAWALNRLDVFVRGPGNNLFHKAWDGAHWQPGQTDLEDLGGDCTGHRGLG
jgi:hypothetical protein